MSDKKTLAQLGVSSRRAVLKGVTGAAAATALAGATARSASASRPTGMRMGPGPGIATRLQDLTGNAQTGRFGARYTDLGIPVRCPDGSMLFVGGDTWDGEHIFQGTWSCPVGLRSGSQDINNLTIDSCVGGAHVRQLVDEPHNPVPGGNTTAIPTDVFRVGNSLYMHLMRGLIYQAHHTDFWRSDDNGETWQFLCKWDDVNQYNGAFQQKTYAIADNNTAYVLSSRFNRDLVSDLILHRVPLDRLGDPSAYQPWGYNGGWGWGNPPSSVAQPRKWGELCFRAMDGKYGFSFFDAGDGIIKLQVIPVPEGDLFNTFQQPLILPGPQNVPDTANLVRNPYGGWIVPGSTFNDFHIIVSQWVQNPGPTDEYHFMHYRIDGIWNP
ncbi:DUF4185 domain-containing protein [Luteipulveratus mongoliensis]|uniref:DUF4185 domain-containing protein n=1 Tax=Luteipulveratus mongoliensis TaxID=571913 RepID=A0A0K1JLN5_9MICO|nr:DUF4185 domain-containing protein [Luteipulveratus mongoliensis]AKU17634.1 hypothetical protein VV02_20295 [Luteipulveratus mongoliensis]